MPDISTLFQMVYHDSVAIEYVSTGPHAFIDSFKARGNYKWRSTEVKYQSVVFLSGVSPASSSATRSVIFIVYF